MIDQVSSEYTHVMLRLVHHKRKNVADVMM